MNKKFCFIILWTILGFAQLHASDIYVPANGSIVDALKQAREWRRLNTPECKENIFIHLADAVYRLDKPLFIRPEDSGTEASKTVILGGTISGAKTISGWKKEGNLWVADAPTYGNRIIYSRQLWVNGKKANLAKSKMQRMIDFSTKDKTITIPKTSVRGNQLEMFVMQRWAIAILRIKKMKDNGNQTIVSFHEPESQLEFAHPWPQPVIGESKGNSGFCLTNSKELLDEPGEWYQDYPSGKIYYMPRKGEKMESLQAEIPYLETLLDINGSSDRAVKWVIFKGTKFQGTSWNRPSREGHVTLQGGFRMLDAYKLLEPGLFHKAELENQAWIARPETAVRARYAENISFQNCTFEHLAATGLDYEQAVNNSTIEECKFEDIGGTAIQVGDFAEQGFETHIPYNSDRLCDHITIAGNKINDATNEDWGCVGISAGYVSNINIVRNVVSNVNYSGICVGWGWTALESGMHDNHIQYNHVHDYARQLYDAGGIYTLSNQPNSTIYGNIIAAPAKAPFATNDRAFAIYFDEATDGYTVTNNKMPKDSFGYNKPGPAMVIKDNVEP